MKILVISCFLIIAIGIISLIVILGLSASRGFKCEEYSASNPVCLITQGYKSTTATGVASGPLKRKVTLTFWGLFIPEKVMAPILTEYNQKNPLVTIKYDEKLFEPEEMAFYKDTVKNRLNTKQAPTIFTVNSEWIPEITNRISTANNTISPKDFGSKYMPLATTSLVTNTSKSIYGIPYIYDGMALFYNKDLLAIENLKPPKTWDEARDVAIATNLKDTKTKSTIRYGLAIGNYQNVDNYSDILGFMLAQNNIKVPAGLSSSDSITIFKKFVNFQKADGVWGLDMPNSINSFALNKVTLVFGKVSDIQRILAINPTLNFGVIELPQLPTLSGNRTNVGWGSLWANTVSNSYASDEQKAAWDFLVWLNENEQLTKLQENTLKYQQVGYVFTNLSFSDKETSKYLKPIINQQRYAKTSYFTGGSGNDSYIESLNLIFSNSGTISDNKVREAVAKLKKTSSDLLPKTTK